ncbi:hypothetical protein Tco_1377911 [Tanacetum coccineum]
MSTRLLSPTVDRQEIESLSETSLQVLLVRVQGVITIQIYQDDEEKTAFPTQVKVPIQFCRQVTPLFKHSRSVRRRERLRWTTESRKKLSCSTSSNLAHFHASRTPTSEEFRNGEADPGISICGQKTAQVFPSAPNSGASTSLGVPTSRSEKTILAIFSSKNQKPMRYSPRAKYNSKNHGSYSRMDRHAWTGRAQASSSLNPNGMNTFDALALNSQPELLGRVLSLLAGSTHWQL